MHSVQLQTVAQWPEPARSPVLLDNAAERKLGAWRALGRRLDAKDPRLAREAAALLTSQLFFAPLLAEMRKLPFGKELGHGGRMEEAFAEQLDLQLADAVARSDSGLTAQLAERLARGPRNASPGKPTPPQTSWPTQSQAHQTGGGRMR
jgi:hypothetical protein